LLSHYYIFADGLRKAIKTLGVLARLALDLLRLSCESKALLLLLLEPRSRHGIRSRSRSGCAVARQTMQMC
jgi:hypothetical protein